MPADAEGKNSEFFICVNLRHLRAIPDSAAAGRAAPSRLCVERSFFIRAIREIRGSAPFWLRFSGLYCKKKSRISDKIPSP